MVPHEARRQHVTYPALVRRHIETVAELKQIIGAMSMTNLDVDARTVPGLSYAAEVLGTGSFRTAARQLTHAADVLPGTVSHLERAATKVAQFY
jgi:hypothetical protein